MRTSVDSESLATLEDSAPRNAYTFNHTPTIILGLGSAGNDATCVDVATFEDDAEPWERQVPVRNRPADRVTGEGAPSARPTGCELQQAGRANRSFMLAQVIVAVLHWAGAIAHRAYIRRRQRREAMAIGDALRGLDDRMLRDLGLDRSEIMSVAAEMTGGAEHTRVRALLSSHGFP